MLDVVELGKVGGVSVEDGPGCSFQNGPHMCFELTDKTGDGEVGFGAEDGADFGR